MNSDEAYAVWAPVESPWSPWVKPILFANEPEWDGSRDPELAPIPEPTWLTRYRDAGPASTGTDVSTAFVVDLPGAAGVSWGLALARRGWRPVPLYNALPGGVAFRAVTPTSATDQFAVIPPPDQSALVDVASILRGLRRATMELQRLGLAAERPPVFLLDAERRFGSGVALPGRFDNRSISLPTDFPSAVFLRSRGIERVVLVQARAEPQEDLAHTLVAWQEGGVSILAKTVAIDGPPEPIQVAKPSQFRALLYRFLATLGLRRHPLGGFGGIIPTPSSG